MGKTTGFMEYKRLGDRTVPPKKRIAGFEEFHLPLSEEQRREQGARCMDCGVPFCQSGCDFGTGIFGCPLHNLIPEWNDSVCEGNYSHALARLLKTNNFPEFTGRVCPALCESACICGIHGDAVTVRDNELAIIEHGFAAGLMEPRVPPQRSGKKIAVVGSGPAGLAAADQLNHRGHSVTVFEREDRIGGLLMYGIPSMKLSKAVVLRREELMMREGVVFITNTEIGRDVSAETLLSDYDCVILCCGAEKPRELSFSGECTSGVSNAMPYLKAATKAVLDKKASPLSAKGKNVVVIGAGDTSADCVATALRQGCASITQLIRKPRELVEKNAGLWRERPYVPDYAEEEARARFDASPRRYGTQCAELISDENGALTAIKTDHGETIKCELLLIAGGFSGCDDEICRAFGVEKNERGGVMTAPDSHKTSVERVFAAGDMHRGQSLVVWAIAEGRAAAAEIDEYLMGYTNLR